MNSILILIGTPFSGRVLTDETGRMKVTGDISTQRWQEANSIAYATVCVLAKACKLPAERIKAAEVLIETSSTELTAAIEVQLGNDASVNQDLACGVTSTFLRGLVGDNQTEISTSDLITDAVSKVINSELMAFKANHAPKRLNHSLVVQRGDVVLTVLKGNLIGSKDQKKAARVRREIQGFYDGRQLRARKLFFVEHGSNCKPMEILYDEAKFDLQLRSLNDNKRAELSISYFDVTEVNGKEYRELESIEVVLLHSVPTADAFELT